MLVRLSVFGVFSAHGDDLTTMTVTITMSRS